VCGRLRSSLVQVGRRGHPFVRRRPAPASGRGSATRRPEAQSRNASTLLAPEPDVCETSNRLGALLCPRTPRVDHYTTRGQTAARVRTTVARPNSESFATPRARDLCVVGWVLELTPALGAAACHCFVSSGDSRRVRIASRERFEHQLIGIVQLLHRGSRRVHAISARALVHVRVQKGSADPEGGPGFAQRWRSAQSEHRACSVELERLCHRRTIGLHSNLLRACVLASHRTSLRYGGWECSYHRPGRHRIVKIDERPGARRVAGGPSPPLGTGTDTGHRLLSARWSRNRTTAPDHGLRPVLVRR
jgi:hypothetical protein